MRCVGKDKASSSWYTKKYTKVTKGLFELTILVSYRYGGEGEIRTHGAVTLGGFQDRYLKPLGHLSKFRVCLYIINISKIQKINAGLTSDNSFQAAHVRS